MYKNDTRENILHMYTYLYIYTLKHTYTRTHTRVYL